MVKALKEERYTTYSSAMSILALESYSTQVAAQSANADALGIVQVGKAGGEPQRISELQGCSCRGSSTPMLPPCASPTAAMRRPGMW